MFTPNNHAMPENEGSGGKTPIIPILGVRSISFSFSYVPLRISSCIFPFVCFRPLFFSYYFLFISLFLFFTCSSFFIYFLSSSFLSIFPPLYCFMSFPCLFVTYRREGVVNIIASDSGAFGFICRLGDRSPVKGLLCVFLFPPRKMMR